jgi:16S rRNA (cytidine1402-2'-O)-methyltransferase
MLFEGPHRLPDMLADAAEVLGDRPAVVARELTKLFETIRRGSLPDLARQFAEEGPPKGEIVVLIGQGSGEIAAARSDAALDGRLEAALQTHSIKDAAALVADELELPKREVYARALVLAKRRSPDDRGEDG